jgi:hypothetical protein
MHWQKFSQALVNGGIERFYLKECLQETNDETGLKKE